MKFAGLEICNHGNWQSWRFGVIEIGSLGHGEHLRFGFLAIGSPGDWQSWRFAVLKICNPGEMQFWRFAVLESIVVEIDLSASSTNVKRPWKQRAHPARSCSNVAEITARFRESAAADGANGMPPAADHRCLLPP